MWIVSAAAAARTYGSSVVPPPGYGNRDSEVQWLTTTIMVAKPGIIRHVSDAGPLRFGLGQRRARSY